MIVLQGVWANPGSSEFSDLWKDTDARGNADRAANAVERGDTEGYWASENVQVGETRTAEFAKRPAGALVGETE